MKNEFENIEQAFGNNFSNNYVVTYGVKIPITKAMYNTILTMIDYVKAS